MTAQVKRLKKVSSGFTLIELLVVIGILAVLLAIVLIAINPARQFSQANNTKRRSDVNAILNGVHQYGADNKGNIAAMSIPKTGTTTATAGAEIASTTVNLYPFLVPTYIAALPVDPLTNNGAAVATYSGSYITRYFITQSQSDNRITVWALDAELGQVIGVTR